MAKLLKNISKYLFGQSKNKYIFVFDLDNTLTQRHSGGHYEKGTLDRYMTKEQYLSVYSLFQTIHSNGDSIYINSRGIANSIYQFLDDTALLEFVSGIYAAYSSFEEQSKKKYKIPIVAKYKLVSSSSKWSVFKTHYLDQIRSTEGVSKDRIYFFDDTKPNVEHAKNSGYTNSFIVNSNMYPNIYEKYNVVKVLIDVLKHVYNDDKSNVDKIEK